MPVLPWYSKNPRRCVTAGQRLLPVEVVRGDAWETPDNWCELRPAMRTEKTVSAHSGRLIAFESDDVGAVFLWLDMPHDGVHNAVLKGDLGLLADLER